jgi:serine protease
MPTDKNKRTRNPRHKRTAAAKRLSRGARLTSVVTDREPRLEALSLTIVLPSGRSPTHAATLVATQANLRNWRVKTVDERRGQFELLPPARVPTPGAAWDAVYRLRDAPDVVHAEPMFRYAVPEAARTPGRIKKASGGGGDEHDSATDQDFEWSLKKTRVIQAWEKFGPRLPGAGVVVGHPDTGFTPHPELAEPARLLASLGFDFEDDDADAADELVDGLLDNPGHGTGTGSVIVSNRGAAAGTNAGTFVSGVAPAASIIPIRATESVVLFSMRGLRLAIDHAVGKGAHVISISLGGPVPNSSIRDAVRRAVDAGVIVLAAAGNRVPFVVFPAAFDEVIAVAASTIRDVPWTGSSHGDAVDITAPGASVWRAQTAKTDAGALQFGVARGNGTSYAVATTAGVAALWVSLHGHAALVQKYGAPNISRVFKSLLQASCRTPNGWDTDDFGPGIVNAEALLAMPLPNRLRARKLRDPRRAAVAMDSTGLETVMHLLPDAPRAGVEVALAELLKVPERGLLRMLQDVGDELAFHVAMDVSLRERLTLRATRPGKRRRAQGGGNTP